MNSTQSIIVYRNPIEQQFWESGIIVPIFGGFLVFFVVFLLCMKALELLNLSQFSNKYQYMTNAVLVLAGMSGVATLAYLLQ